MPSTRVIVKNLPKDLTDERFRAHFEKRGNVTDARLMKTPSGVSRRFGYIGYSTAEDARAAIEYFNNTFIYTSKIQVEEAKSKTDPNLPRPWSAHSAGSSAYLRRHGLESGCSKESENAAKLAEQKAKREKLLKELCEDDENEKLKEYLEVVQPRSKAKTWTNDDGLAKVAKQAAKVAKQGRAPVISTSTAKDRSKSDDDYQDLPKDHASEGIFEEEVADEADDGAKTLAHDQSVSDLDYLRSKMKSSISLLDETESNAEEQADEGEEGNPPQRGENEVSSELLADTDTRLDDEKPETKSAADSLAQAECAEEDDPIRQISDTGRLFVRNLPYSTLEEDLRRAFEPFGPLSEVHLPIDKETKAPKGYAYVLYLIPEHAVKAYQAMDRSIYQGRILHVIPAKEKPDLLAGANGESEASGISLKKKKELKRKATSRNEFNWNSLFMSQDAVAASIAERLGVSKADIMDPTADNAAVRLALAETQLIAETKEYLEENGIRVTATSSTGGKTKRSDTVILVKNILYGTTEEELRELFGKHGELGRILIPPAGTMAVVEFLHPSEARAAFSHLAYKRVKSTILYLEKAPVNVFREAYDPSKTDKAAATKAAAAATPAKEAETLKSTLFSANVKNDPDALAVASGSTLFVKNLNFSTKDEALRRLFSALPGFRSAKVSTKPDPRGGSGAPRLSMGFGFVEFDSAEHAASAVRGLQGAVLDGHKLQIKVSHRGTEDAGTKKGGLKKGEEVATGKLLVRNVPFEATKKDLRELFGAFGHLKSVRLPSKFAGGHRGFAFVEYLTPSEATNARDNVGAAHLYGRHLVIEPAREGEDDVEAIRERTGKRFARDSLAGGLDAAGRKAKRKKILQGDGDDDERDES